MKTDSRNFALKFSRMNLASAVLFGVASLFFRCGDEPGPDPVPVFNPVFSSSVEDIREFIDTGDGGANAKLVFVDGTSAKAKLCYIDFSENSEPPVIHEITAAKDPSVPVLSPDGEWVVYGSGPGAEAGSPAKDRSSVFICRLSETATPVLVAKDSACEPRFVQDPEDGKQTVIYTTLALDLGWEGNGKTMTVDINTSGTTPIVGSPEVFVESGSYTGGLSINNRYLCGGGGHVAMLDLENEAGRPETLSFGVQGCNASITSSSIFQNTLMHLNTEGTHSAINNGTPWTVWQVILISNYEKELVKGYVYPSECDFPLETEPASFTRAKWHHPEWSNHPYFAAATLNAERFYKKSTGKGYNNTYYQERIYLINLRDSAYIEILHPDTIKYSGLPNDDSGFYWPWLWVQIPEDFIEDPEWLKAP